MYRHPKHSKLSAVRTAVENGEGMLDKEITSQGDLLIPKVCHWSFGIND